LKHSMQRSSWSSWNGDRQQGKETIMDGNSERDRVVWGINCAIYKRGDK